LDIIKCFFGNASLAMSYLNSHPFGMIKQGAIYFQ